jgi:hypothetical protein
MIFGTFQNVDVERNDDDTETSVTLHKDGKTVVIYLKEDGTYEVEES